SLFESLNHILAVEDLLPVFTNIACSLRRGGVFLFDLNGEQAFEQYWNSHHAIVEDDNVCICRSSYDSVDRLGTVQLTMFRRDSTWTRSDVSLVQRCHDFGTVYDLLKCAGLEVTAALDAVCDLGMPEEIGVSRCFFL